MKNTIVIKVWRGTVSEVYADDPDLQVVVVDEDEPETENVTPLPAHRIYE